MNARRKRARLVCEEQKDPLNEEASRRNQMMSLELSEAIMKSSQAEMAAADEVMRKRMQKAYEESLVK